MNKVLKSLLILFGFIIVASCSKSDSTSIAPLRDYEVQKDTDMDNIETFMKTHYMTVVNNPGSEDDMDVTYTLIPAGGSQVSIWDQTDYPKQSREVTITYDTKDVTYTIYYLLLREGTGTDSKSPCNVDNVLTAYRGEYVYTNTVTITNTDNTTTTTTTIEGTQFEENKNPSSFFSLTGVVRGWSEIFPKLKTGSYSENTDGTITYGNFGAAVMFIPSGLAYYRNTQGIIPAYSPLVFSVKLFEIQRADQDGDGVLSYLENVSATDVGYMYNLATGVSNPNDTDEDGIPDFLDADDDADGYLTSYEIKNLVDDTTYPFDEIPTCGTLGNGKKRYLDPTCHN